MSLLMKLNSKRDNYFHSCCRTALPCTKDRSTSWAGQRTVFISIHIWCSKVVSFLCLLLPLIILFTHGGAFENQRAPILTATICWQAQHFFGVAWTLDDSKWWCGYLKVGWIQCCVRLRPSRVTMGSSRRWIMVRGGRSLNCCNIWAIVGVVRVMKGCSQCFVTLECCALLPGDVFFYMEELSEDLQCVPTSAALFCCKKVRLISIRSQWILMHFKKTKESETNLKGKPVQFEVTMSKAQLRDTWVPPCRRFFWVTKTSCSFSATYT